VGVVNLSAARLAGDLRGDGSEKVGGHWWPNTYSNRLNALQAHCSYSTALISPASSSMRAASTRLEAICNGSRGHVRGSGVRDHRVIRVRAYAMAVSGSSSEGGSAALGGAAMAWSTEVEISVPM
jgi:hypothetical protein